MQMCRGILGDQLACVVMATKLKINLLALHVKTYFFKKLAIRVSNQVGMYYPIS